MEDFTTEAEEVYLPEGSMVDYIVIPGLEKLFPRKAQIEVLEKIDDAVRRGIKYIVVQAPTGTGKSVIAYALLRAFKRGYICTNTKGLQTQYLRDFPDTREVRGRSNFTCFVNGKGCDEGACRLTGQGCKYKPTKVEAGRSTEGLIHSPKSSYYWQGSEKKRCPYWVQKLAAVDSDKVIHNYPYILTESNYVGDFKQRNILVSDEGHNIESAVSAFISLSITKYMFELMEKETEDITFNFPDTSAIQGNETAIAIKYMAWLEETKKKCEEVISKLESSISEIVQHIDYSEKVLESEKKRDPYAQANMTFLISEDLKFKRESLSSLEGALLNITDTNIVKRIENVINVMLEDPDNWVIKENRNNYGNVVSVDFKPVNVSKYAKEKYFSLGRINVILSATIGDPYQFTKDLGIGADEFEYIEIPPSFPVKNHRIFKLDIADFSWVRERGCDPFACTDFCKAVVERIDMILELFPNKKGIIHCNKYDISKAIQDHSRYKDRFVAHESGKDREEKLKEHAEREDGAVLLSPSMTEGVDLAGTLSEFQILIKYPLPNMKDPAVEKRRKQDPKYYNYRATITTVQALGRSVRSEDDKVVTFTLDIRFEKIKDKAFRRHVVVDLEDNLKVIIDLHQENEKAMKSLPEDALIKTLSSEDFYNKLTCAVERPGKG